MHIEQSDLLKGMKRDFIMDFMEIPLKDVHKEGDILFREGDKARYFYILLKGHVRISIGDNGHIVHIVDHEGGAFGWSSLLDMEVYSASAECRMPTEVLKFDVKDLKKVFEHYPAGAHVFYKRLAGIIGNRLIQSYKMISRGLQQEVPTSFGSRQVSETSQAQ